MQTLTKKRARAMLGHKLEGFRKGDKADHSPEAHSALGAFSAGTASPPTDAYYLPDNWRAALAGARAHACHDGTRPFLCQIVLTGEYAVATDGHRLVRMSCPLHQGGVPTGELPPERWVRLPAHIGWEHFPSNGNAHVKIWHDYPEGRAQLASGGLRLSAHTEAGDPKCEDPLRGFPPVWDRVIPGGEPTAELTIQTPLWAQALDNTAAPAVILEPPEPTGDEYKIALREYHSPWHGVWSPEGRTATLGVRKYTGEWARSVFDPGYLRDAMEALVPSAHVGVRPRERSDARTLTIQCYGRNNPRGFSNDPIVLRRGDSLALVMPRRM